MPCHEKVRSLDAIVGLIDKARADGKKIVHCHGVFDLLHVGHIRHFDQARSFGDLLVVTVTPDRHVNKGPHRPAFPEHLRMEAVAALSSVDFVALNEWPTAVETLQRLRPHFYVKGPDYQNAADDHTGGIGLERSAAESCGGQLVFTDDVTFSSSHLINRYMSQLPDEAARFLATFRERYKASDVLAYLKDAHNLRVLIIGETIIDEYQYCKTMGKSGKEPMLAARYVSKELFAGGVLAAANHAAAFCDHVGLVSVLGTVDSHEAFIRRQLSPRVLPTFLHLEGAPTLVKRRFVEKTMMRKLFEIYLLEDDEGLRVPGEALCELLQEHLPNYDVVVVADYGHGMLGPEAIELICKEARFLALNTQLNAHNHGFNTVSKYSRADYVCISEHELRLEARNRHDDLHSLVLDVAERLSCEHILITRGAEGTLAYTAGEGFCSVPALAGPSAVVDRVGAGDSVLAVSSLCVARKAPMEIVGLVANAVGSQAIATVGNRTATQQATLFKYIESLVK